MMTRTLPALAALALLSLAGCKKGPPEVVDSRAPDPMAEQLKNAAPVELPPSVEATVTMRCKDNSLIYIDFFSGHKLANLKTTKDGSPIPLTAEADGKPYAGGGYTVEGTAKSVEYSAPGKGAQACKV